MPRDGYDTVTLPTDLLNRLDDRAGDDESRADVVERLLDATNDGEREFAVSSEASDGDDLERRLERIEDVLNGLPGRVADELANEFGPGRP